MIPEDMPVAARSSSSTQAIAAIWYQTSCYLECVRATCASSRVHANIYVYIYIYNQERTCLSSAPVPLRNFTVQPSVADMEKGCKSIGVILSGRSWGSWFGADQLESTVLI